MEKKFEVKLNWKQITLLSVSVTFGYGFILYLLDNELTLKNLVGQSLIYGVAMTLFFIFLFPKLKNKLVGKRVDTIKPGLLADEVLEREIFANLFRGFEGVGGKIFLTNQRLIFKSHSLNIQKGQTNIDYNDIVSVTKRKTFKLRDNGIKITTKKGDEYCFVVNNRDVELKNILDKLNV
ncbi:GRAM domain-containing protein [Polaribacter sp. KT 15]|uniref:GRAM domain-containing protein n=1 Tax=Polaribacter sp. KT 15 TaxID=1896175 RepID=UPI00090A1CD9|nr:GRAM domain-containing protein [Polaribacter sp. KT 15]SHM95728.1 GRAM domain-containing protein [Polaribacter sp. KT 15]